MKLYLITLCALIATATISAQKPWTSRDSSTVEKLKKTITLSEAKVQKAQVKVDYADSLIQVGSSQLAEGKSLKKQLKTETKSLTKQYAVDKKPLLKISKSKNRDEAAEAKAEIKAIDAKFKIDSKELSNKTKANDKLISTGERNLGKGKGYIKTYERSLKDAQADLQYAQEELDWKLEDLNFDEEPESEKKGKKKKK
ncbi:hypothetical protein [Plebeiibacterium marinum]|uniref:DUF5667 domain-containing protein n=1 Tax=Plebeiibacterium marinum TaxID=2992111 RepID=A0AAE3MDT4_9BACT|nr:hypothetical protein [Plebeiobacterium marinum]MCW3805606.1 hypothetical protein [Plebeiobacterium marinum]